MKKLSKIFAFLLCLSLVLTACDSGTETAQPQPDSTEPASSEAQPESSGEESGDPAPVAEGDLSFTPGTYTATASGHNGPMEVEVEVDETSILSVTILSHFETAGVHQVLDVVPQAIVAQQSLAVDTVSGATFCGRGVINAATDCLTQAGGDMDKLTEKIETPPDADTSYEADVIVIGGGGSGLAAAVSAHQQGSSVIVVEKLGMVGGSTVFSGGAFNTADPEMQASIEMTESNEAAIQTLLDREPHDDYEAGLQTTVAEQLQAHKDSGSTGLFDSPELHQLQTYNGGDYAGTPELIRVMCENGLDTLKWVESVGAEWSPNIGAATGSLWQRSHYGTADYPDGFHSVFPYERYIEQNDGVEIQKNTAAYELIVEDGRVTGVMATRNGGTMTYTAAKGVVMATGGFGANVEMRQQYNEQWDNLDSSIGCSNQNVAAQGDGIVMGEAAGAQLIDMGLIQLHPNGTPGTGNMMNNPATSGLNRFYVNAEGNRFIAEDARRDDTVNAIYAQPGGFMWIIADSTRYPPDEQPIKNEVLLGNTFQADTIEELAEMIDVPAENLQAALDQYNAVVDGGEDPLGLKTYGVQLGNAPFYAAKRLPTVHHTMGGLKIDTQARVLDANDNPIPGFYAAGEVTGGIHGANRLGGNAIVDINVFGKIAGESASAEA